jgi:hypothetical protein
MLRPGAADFETVWTLRECGPSGRGSAQLQNWSRFKDQAIWNRSSRRAGDRAAPGWAGQMSEDLGDHGGLFDGGMIFKTPPRYGQCSISKTRLSKRAQLIRRRQSHARARDPPSVRLYSPVDLE